MNKFKANDQIKCTKSSSNTNFTVGNIYQIELNGDVKDDNRATFKPAQYKTAADWLEHNGFRFEIVNNNKIVITQSDNRTIARMYDDNKVIKSSEAKCSPTDTYDFATGAKLAFDRLMPSEPQTAVVEEKKTEDKHVYKVGDKVKVISDGGGHPFDVGEIIELYEESSDGGCWRGRSKKHCRDYANWINTTRIEPYTEPTTPKEPTYYNGKVMCTATNFPNSCACKGYTVGRIYSVKDGYITNDFGNQNIIPKTSIQHLCEGMGNTFIEYKGEAL